MVVENFPATYNYPEFPTILGTQEKILNICWWPMCNSSSENCWSINLQNFGIILLNTKTAVVDTWNFGRTCMPKPINHLAIHCSVCNMSNIYRWLLQLSKNLQLVRQIQHTLRWNYRCLQNYRNTSKFEVAISAIYYCLPKVQVIIGWGLQKIHQNFRWLLQLTKDILRHSAEETQP